MRLPARLVGKALPSRRPLPGEAAARQVVGEVDGEGPAAKPQLWADGPEVDGACEGRPRRERPSSPLAAEVRGPEEEGEQGVWNPRPQARQVDGAVGAVVADRQRSVRRRHRRVHASEGAGEQERRQRRARPRRERAVAEDVDARARSSREARRLLGPKRRNRQLRVRRLLRQT